MTNANTHTMIETLNYMRDEVVFTFDIRTGAHSTGTASCTSINPFTNEPHTGTVAFTAVRGDRDVWACTIDGHRGTFAFDALTHGEFMDHVAGAAYGA